MNSPNGGVSVKVRGNPGGLWHNRPTVRRPESQGTSVGDPKPNVYVSPSPFSNVLALSVVTQTTSTPDTLTSSSSNLLRSRARKPNAFIGTICHIVTETTNLAVAESTPATVLSNLPSEPKNGDSSISKCADHGYPRTLKKRKRRTRRTYIEEADIFQSSAIVFAVYEETRLSDSKSAKTSGSKTNKVRKIIKPVRRSTRLSLQNLPSVLKDKKDIYKSLSEVPKRMGSLFQPNNFLCA